MIPDQAHKGPAFLPWHRAFLLQFERALQMSHPHVSLPFWRESVPSVPSPADPAHEVAVFSNHFMGTTIPNSQIQGVAFDTSNPLVGWNIGTTELRRRGFNRSDVSWSSSDASFFSRTRFRSLATPNGADSMSFHLENNPHNIGHGWVGGWMSSCRTSPQDPIFWLFHCDIDRIWGKWQWALDRFGSDGSDPLDFEPNDSYVAGSTTPLGHHLKDTMWPWDQKTGPGNSPDGNDNRPADAPGSPFPQSPTPGTWPSQPAKPRVGDMIDYLGVNGAPEDLGFSYADVPFGVRPATILVASANDSPDRIKKAKDALAILTNKTAAWADRIAKSEALRGLPLSAQGNRGLLTLLKDKTESDSLRIGALRLLQGASGDDVLNACAYLLQNPKSGGAELRAEAADYIGITVMFAPGGMKKMRQFHPALVTALNDKSADVRNRAMEHLAVAKNKAAIDRLQTTVKNPQGTGFTKASAVSFLAVADPHGFADTVRHLLDDADPEVVDVALTALVGDAKSRKSRQRIAGDRGRSPAVRQAAIRSLMRDADGFSKFALGIAVNKTEDEQTRATAIAGIATNLRHNGPKFTPDAVGKITDQISGIEVSGRPQLAGAVKNLNRAAQRFSK